MLRLRSKLEVKLNGAISDVQFKPSLKCGIAENINFRKCRIGARAPQRARKREVSSDAHMLICDVCFSANSPLNETRHFSVSFNRSVCFSYEGLCDEKKHIDKNTVLRNGRNKIFAF